MTARPPAATPATIAKAAARAGNGMSVLAVIIPAARDEDAATLLEAAPEAPVPEAAGAEEETPVTMAIIISSCDKIRRRLTYYRSCYHIVI